MKKCSKKFDVLAIIMAVFMLSLAGCSKTETNSDLQGTKFDSNISMVQNGHPELIPNITYKEAYDYFFADPEWRGFTADDGAEVVEFSGECTYYDEDAKVYIQFVIDDEESFSMYHASLTVGEEKFTVDDQTFIELIYNPFEMYSQEVLSEELDQEVQDAFTEIFNSIEEFEQEQFHELENATFVKSEVIEVDYPYIYGGIMDTVTFNDWTEYTYYDIDNNGYLEFIVQNGTCNADLVWDVYSTNGNVAMYLGKIAAGNCRLYENKEGVGFYTDYCKMGYESVRYIVVQNGKLVETTLYEGETEVYGYFNGEPIKELEIPMQMCLLKTGLGERFYY